MKTLDRHSGIPLYHQIRGILAEEISHGAPEVSTMTEKELVQRFRVSRATVRQALNRLVEDGAVYRDRAKGTFPVAPHQSEHLETVKLGGLVGYLAGRCLELESEVRDVRRTSAPDDVRRALLMEPGEEVLGFTRKISIDGQPISWRTIYVRSPDGFLPSPEALNRSGSALALLDAEYGISYSRSEHHVWATAATADDARSLGVPVGDPLLVLQTTVSSREGTPGVWRRVVERSEEIKHVFAD
jgi:GntR family transcriptional regulator